MEIRTSPTSASTNSTDRIAPELPLGAHFLNQNDFPPEGFVDSIFNEAFDASVEQLPDLPRKNGVSSTNTVFHDGHIYMVGGHDGTAATSNVLIYDFESAQWTQGPSMPVLLQGMALVSHMDKIYSLGGYDISFNRVDDVHVLDTQSNTWSTGVDLTVAKQHGAAFSDGTKIYYVGGDQAHQASDFDRDDIYSMNPDVDGSWTLVQQKLTYLYADGTYVYTGGKFYLMGSEQLTERRKITVYDPVGRSTSALASLPADSRQAVAFGFNNKIYLIGGTDTETSIYEYSIADDTWTTFTVTTPVDVSYTGWAQDENSGYITGGSLEDHFLKFNPPQDRNFVQLVNTEDVGDDLVPFSASILTRDANSPTGYTALNESVESDSTIAALTSFPVAFENTANNLVYGENKVYTLFGRLDSTYSDLVYAYDVNSDSWSIESTAPFTARKNGGAVAFKDKLYHFGGLLSPSDAHSTETLIYSTQSGWTTGPVIPQGLQQIEATVADNFIYLVGGHTGSSDVASAYSWNPEAGGVWTTLASMNLGRTQHCVAEYQGKLYVFGGSGGNDQPQSKEVYDPQSDSWTLHTNDLPETLQGHKCVTLGDRIYLMGGDLGAGNGKSRVYEFDPATGSYIQLEDFSEGLSFPNMATDGKVIYILTRTSGNFRAYRPEGKFFVHQNQTGGKGGDLPQSLAVVETTSAAIEGFDSSGNTLESTAGTDFFLHFRNITQLTSLVGIYDDFRDQDGDSGLFVSSDSNSNEVMIRSGGKNLIEVEKNGSISLESDQVKVAGIVSLGETNIDNMVDGSIRWTGSDLQIRQGGTWNSLTESQVKEIRDTDGDTFITVDNGSDPDLIDFQVNGALAMTINTDTNVGIGTVAPQEKLEVNGALLLGNTGNNNAGSIRFNGSDFEGFNGGSWISFTSGSSSAGSSGVGENSFIGAGSGNSASSTGAFVGAGTGNSAANQDSSVVGGNTNSANADNSFVGGGDNNSVNGPNSAILGGSNNQISSQLAAIVGGYENFVGGLKGFVGAGTNNNALGDYSSVVGGNSNTAALDYAIVAGGQNNVASSTGTFIGGGEFNGASGQFSSVVGGQNNTAQADYSFVGGGGNNQAFAPYSTISGGDTNQTQNLNAFVGGGLQNIAGGLNSLVVAGQENRAAAQYSSVVGGLLNTATGDFSFVGGGQKNLAGSTSTFIGGGEFNGASGQYSSVVGGQNNTAQADYSFVGGGGNNQAFAPYSTISGGDTNQTQNLNAFVGGGLQNIAGGLNSLVVAGQENRAAAQYSSVVGGLLNTATGDFSFVGGGQKNLAGSTSTFIGGGEFNGASGQYSSVVGGQNNTAQADYSFVGGGGNNQAFAPYSTISGGDTNQTQNLNAFIGGGLQNIAGGLNSLVVAGQENRATAQYSSVVGGLLNTGTGDYSFVGGGQKNQASSTSTFIGGGEFNGASGQYSSVVGGQNNTAQADYSVVGGGSSNSVGGTYSVIPGGQQLTLNADNSFGFNGSGSAVAVPSGSSMALFMVDNFGVNAPSTDATFEISSTQEADALIIRDGGGSIEMVVDAGGRVGIGTGSPHEGLHVIGSGEFTEGLNVGFDTGNPAADQLAIGDANFYMDGSDPSIPIINWDTNVWQNYNRGANIYTWYSTSEIMRLSSTADLSIGTLTQVDGLLTWGELISIQNTGEARYHLYNQGGQAEWKMGQKSGVDHDYKISKVVSGNEFDYFMIDYASGFVGVGTTTPTTMMEVSGGAQFDDVVVVNHNNTTGGGLQISDDGVFYDNNDGYIHLGNKNGTGGNGLSIDGKLGVGTASPASKLDVNGQILATSIDSSGPVTATAFYGDGSQLIGIVSDNSSEVVTVSDIEFSDGTTLGGDLVAFAAEKNGVNQTLSNNSLDLVTFTAEVYDYGSDYDTSNSKFTAPIKGIYLINVMVMWSPTVDNTNLQLFLKKNGSTTVARHIVTATSTPEESNIISVFLLLNATDYLQVEAIHSAGTDIAIKHPTFDTYFQGMLMRKVP